MPHLNMIPQRQSLPAPSLYVMKDAPVIHLKSEPSQEMLRQITIRKNGASFHIRSEEIVRCEADSNYSYIFYGSGQKVIVAKTLKSIGLSLLSSEFVRVHRSHLVRRDDIDVVYSDHLLLQNGDVIPVSRAFRRTKLKRLIS